MDTFRKIQFSAMITLLMCMQAFSQFGPPREVRQITDLPADCKNPQFMYGFFWDISSTNFLVYEAHKNNTAGIYYQTYFPATNSFSKAAKIVDDGFTNINPVVFSLGYGTARKVYVYWQTNKNGNWDIAYSVFFNGVWSAPAMYAATAADEASPKLMVGERLHGMTYMESKNVHMVTFTDTLITDRIVFAGSESRSYGMVTGLLNYNRSLIAVQVLENGRNDHWVYKEIGPTISEEKTVNAPVMVNSAEFIEGFYTFGTTDGLCIDAVVDGKKQVYYAGSEHLQDASKYERMVTDSTMQAFRFKQFTLPFVCAGDGFTPYVHGPSSIYYELNDKLFIAPDPFENHSATPALLVPVAYKQSRATVGVITNYVYNYSGAISFCVWEDSSNGYVQLFGRNRFDPLGSVGPVSAENGFTLFNNYPNPFNPSTVIEFTISKDSKVVLEVFDVTGIKVAELLNGVMNQGAYAIRFNAGELPSGVYLARISSGNTVRTLKMIYMK